MDPLTAEEKRAAQAALDTGDGPTIQAIADELEREFEVRKRIYPRWLQSKQITRTEADSRMEAHAGAMAIVQAIRDHQEKLDGCREAAEV